MKKFNKVVMVEWVDSAMPASRWLHLSDYDPDLTYCYTVGWIYKETKEQLTLVMNIGDPYDDDNQQGANFMTIPKVAIKNIRRMK